MRKVKFVLLFIVMIKSSTSLFAQYSDSVSVSLFQLFELADQNNREIKILDYKTEMAQEVVKDAKKKLLPSLDASLSISYNGDGLVIDRDFANTIKAPIPDFGNNFVIEATQVIYAGGAIKNSIGLAELDHSFAQLEKEENRQNIRFTITGFYLELLKLNNQQKVLQHNIEQTKLLLEEMKAKHEQGTMLSNNVTRYELQLQSLELTLLQINNRVTIINNELVKMVRLPYGVRLRLDDADIISLPDSQSNNEWQTIALNNAYSLKQSTIKIEKSKREEKLVYSDNLPQVFAFAGNQLNGPITIEIPAINKNFNYWYVGLGVKYNIASLYKNKAKKSQARLVTELNLEANKKVKEELSNEMEDAYINYKEAMKVYETQLKNVELASENYRVVKNRYLNDLVLITEMLDAENSKLDAELKATNAQINIAFHYYQLKKLSGTL